jgi:O-antigen/teichoic acid export membrane protein
MSAMRELASNYFVQVSGKVLSVLFGLVTVGILTRALGDAGFGEYTTAVTFLSLFGVFVDFGLTLTLVQMISKDHEQEDRIVGNVYGLRLVSGVVFYAIAPLAVLAFPYSSSVKLGVAIGALGFLFMSTAGMLVGVFQKHLAMWRFAVAELVNRAAYLLLVAGLASLGYGLTAMIGAMVIANFLWLLVTLFLAKPLVCIRPRFDLSVWKHALWHSWPIALSIIFNLVYLRGDIILLANYREAAEVGQYGVAYKVVDVLTAFPVMFMGLLLPKLTHSWHGRNREEFAAFMQHAFDLFAICVIPIAVGAQIAAEGLTVFIAGSGYEPAGAVLQILILAVVFVFISTLYGHAIVSLEKQRPMMFGYAATAAISLVAYLILIPRFGMWGAALVTVGSEALIALLTFLVVCGASGAWPKLTTAAKALTGSVIMYAALAAIPPLHVLLEVTIGATIYAAALLGTGGIKWSQIQMMTALGRPKP